jgi:hypothetical protein
MHCPVPGRHIVCARTQISSMQTNSITACSAPSSSVGGRTTSAATPFGSFVKQRGAAAFQMAEALGIDPAPLAYGAGSGDTLLAEEESLRALLCAAFQPGIERGLATSVDAGAIAVALDHLLSYISASGPFATLRLGSQPYGLLPVLVPDRARLVDPDAGLVHFLDKLREHVFAPAVDRVPRIGAPGTDPGKTLLDLLRVDALTRQLRVRPLVTARLLDELRTLLPLRIVAGLDAARVPILDLLAALGDPSPEATAIGHAALLPDAGPVTRPLVAPADAESDERPQAYLQMLAGLPLVDLLVERYPAPRPSAFFFDLARLALLQAADSAARRWLIATGVDPVEIEDPASPIGTAAGRFGHEAPDDPARTIADRLDDPTAPDPAPLALRAQLRRLSLLMPESLETLLTGVLPLLGSRLDAWYTGFAIRRLKVLRGNPPAGRQSPHGYTAGLGVGAFGWLEAIPRRGSKRRNGGYVHAPSAQHAATAGVLMSADLAHRDSGHGDTFAVDLSSRRVRTALELLDGIRNGQPLGALLGYRIERALVDHGGTAPALIARLRAAAPLVANRRSPSTSPAETVAADSVVDGLVLLSHAGYEGKAPPTVDALVAHIRAVADADKAPLLEVLEAAADAVDAVADLLLAESVHQMVGGTTMRAAAAGDAMSGAPIPPPAELEVTRTPQRGIATTHRVLMVLDPAATRTAGWDETPRALAEPLVDIWASRLLPEPRNVRIRARFSSSTGEPPIEETLLLSELLAKAQDAGRTELAIGALDVVLTADPSSPVGGPVLAARVAELAEPWRPATHTAALVLDPVRDTAWSASEWSLAELAAVAHALGAVVGGARAVMPADLAPPGAAASASVVAADQVDRVAPVRKLLDAVAKALDEASDDASRRQALYSAQLHGLPASPEAGQLDRQATAAYGEAQRRLKASDEPKLDEAERLRCLLGRDLPVVPRIPLANHRALAAEFKADLGATPGEVRAFLDRAARVREPIARLNALLGVAEAVAIDAIGTPLAPAVAQQPRREGERWTALPGAIAAGRVSLVALAPAGSKAAEGETFAGLMIDEWTEVVPAAHADTSVAFHLDAPSSAAPNAWLLLVPDEGRELWPEAEVLQHVLEALDLAKLRAIDPDLLGAAGQLLPGLLTADGAFGASFAEQATRSVEQP